MLCVFLLFLLFGNIFQIRVFQSSNDNVDSLPEPAPKVPECDDLRADILREGNIGQSGYFPWLGLLRVHLHEFNQLKIAVTGLVLVKSTYAIANADDVARIPRTLFIQDSKAMFIPKRGEPWFTKLKDYMLHPEYEYATINTIALVELRLEEGASVPFKPVCSPGYYFNTSNQIFAMGYTDDNKIMEKTFHTLEYVKPTLCNEFYNRVGFTEPKSAPTSIQCGFAKNNTKDCVWENGMAMVSNASGKWTLIGLSIRGPGCSAPARFLDMSVYFPWVESATDLDEINDYPPYRRKTALGVGFRRSGNTKQVPQDNAITTTEVTPGFTLKYPGGGDSPRPYKIYKLAPGQQQWWEMPLHLEEAGFLHANRCSIPKEMVYRERMRLVDQLQSGGGYEYRVTLYDKHIHNYTCLKLKVRNARSREPVLVWLRHDLDMMEGTNLKGEGGETPSDILKMYPLPPKINLEGSPNRLIWKPGKHLRPQYITDKSNRSGIENLNIIIGFNFLGEASMELFVYGIPYPLFPRTTSTTEPPTKEEPRVSGMRKRSPRMNRPGTNREYDVREIKTLRHSNRKHKTKEVDSLRDRSDTKYKSRDRLRYNNKEYETRKKHQQRNISNREYDTRKESRKRNRSNKEYNTKEINTFRGRHGGEDRIRKSVAPGYRVSPTRKYNMRHLVDPVVRNSGKDGVRTTGMTTGEKVSTWKRYMKAVLKEREARTSLIH